jgi:hypothetical protein
MVNEEKESTPIYVWYGLKPTSMQRKVKSFTKMEDEYRDGHSKSQILTFPNDLSCNDTV